MAVTQDELFQLIKSLSKSEKKFFTQYVNIYEKGSSPIYLQLFSYLNEQPAYDEDLLFKKFRDPGFKKNYAVTKHYLKNLIIKTLRHSEITVREDRDLTVYILDIKRLMAKGLFAMAKRQIEKLKEEAYQEEKFLDLIHLIAMQRGLISMGLYRHEPNVTLDTLDEEEELAYERIRQLRQTMNASIKLYGLMHFDMNAIPEEAMHDIEKLCLYDYLKQENYSKLLSAKARHTFLQFWTLYYCAVGDYKNYLAFAHRKLKFVMEEKIPPTVTNWLVIAYNHVLAASLLSREFEEFEKKLKFLEEMELHSQFHDADRFQTVAIYGLLYNVMHNNEKKSRYYLQYAAEGIKQHYSFLNKAYLYTLRATMAYTLLRLKEYDNCLNEINDLMNLTNAETRRDYVGHVRIINLMLRFEMKEQQLVANLLKNTYRFFMNYLYTTPIHKFAIRYMKDALRTSTPGQLRQLNADKLAELKKLRFNPHEADMALVMIMENYLQQQT